MSHAPGGPQDDDGPRIAELMAHYRAHRPDATRIFGGCVALSMVVAAVLPSRYSATAVLAVLPAPEFTVRQDAGSHAFSSSALAMDQIMKAETAILESDELHSRTLGAVGLAQIYPALDPTVPRGFFGNILHFMVGVPLHAILAPWSVAPSDAAAARQEKALQWFAGDLRIVPTKEANIITVTLSNGSAKISAKAVNTMLARYAERRASLYDDPQLAVVRKQTETSARAVREADAALTAFKAAHAIADIGAERDLLLRRRSDTEQALATAAADAAAQQARLAALVAQIDALPLAVPLYRENDADTRVQALDVALVDLRGRMEAAREQYRDTSRKVTDLRTQISSRALERQHMLANPLPSVNRDGRSPALDPLLLDRAHAATDGAGAIARMRALRADLVAEETGLARLTQAEAALAELTRRHDAAAESFATASRVQEEQRITEAEDALRLATVRVIQSARVPQRPAPIPLLTIIAGFFLGFAGAAGWVLMRFSMQPTFLTAEGLAAATGLPVLGVFPASVDA